MQQTFGTLPAQVKVKRAQGGFSARGVRARLKAPPYWHTWLQIPYKCFKGKTGKKSRMDKDKKKRLMSHRMDWTHTKDPRQLTEPQVQMYGWPGKWVWWPQPSTCVYPGHSNLVYKKGLGTIKELFSHGSLRVLSSIFSHEQLTK